MYYGNSGRNRISVDERVIFERLWRGALCQALGDKAPLRAAQRRQCCCHCQCMASVNCSQNGAQFQSMAPKRALKSVVR